MIAHTEAAARLGGAVALEVDLTRLVRPPTPAAAGDPLLAAAELVVRTACVGEARTVPILKLTRRAAGSALVEAALGAIPTRSRAGATPSSIAGCAPGASRRRRTDRSARAPISVFAGRKTVPCTSSMLLVPRREHRTNIHPPRASVPPNARRARLHPPTHASRAPLAQSTAMAREPSGSYNSIMVRESSVFRKIGIASVVLWLTAAGSGSDGAQAKQCSNPCEVGDGDICASVRLISELGRPLAMHPGRQSGTCGGVKPLPADQLVLTWSRDPAGPFTPIPGQRRGDDVLITPDSAGAYYIEAAARDGAGAPDRAVVLVVDPKTAPVRLQLQPDKGLAASATSVKVRWVPPASADRFPRRRWPVWLDNDRAGMAGQPLRLPTGHYDVEWTHVARDKTQTGVTTIEVTGAGSVDVPLRVASAAPGSGPAASQALSSAKPGCSTAKSPVR